MYWVKQVYLISNIKCSYLSCPPWILQFSLSNPSARYSHMILLLSVCCIFSCERNVFFHLFGIQLGSHDKPENHFLQNQLIWGIIIYKSISFILRSSTLDETGIQNVSIFQESFFVLYCNQSYHSLPQTQETTDFIFTSVDWFCQFKTFI